MSSSDESDENELTPPEIQAEAKLIVENLLPSKSKEKYLKTYADFNKWKIDWKSKSLSENVFLAYFNQLIVSNKYKPTTLWAVYSMLKSTVLVKHNLNISTYRKLTTMLKRQGEGYKCKKSKVLSRENIENFLSNAPDSEYLATKVVLIFGIYGACRSIEITNISVTDVQAHGDQVIVVTLRNTKTKTNRNFVIHEPYMELIKRYQALRPTGTTTERFFLGYRSNKCIKQPMGKHTIGAMPLKIAKFLNLPDANNYTGHCFRRSSATFLADSGANLTTIKRHGGWKSDRVAESYIEESIENKSKISSKVSRHINETPLANVSENKSALHQQESPSKKSENLHPQPSTSFQEPPTFISTQSLTVSQQTLPRNVTNTFNNCSFQNCIFK